MTRTGESGTVTGLFACGTPRGDEAFESQRPAPVRSWAGGVLAIITSRLAWLTIAAMAGVFLACTAAPAVAAEKPDLVPWPKSIELREGRMELTSGSTIVATDAKLAPLAGVLQQDIFLLTDGWLRLPTATGQAHPGDIVLRLDPAVAGPEAYRLGVGEHAEIKAGTYRGAAWGEFTLVQAMQLQGNELSLPHMSIADEPAVAGRFVMIDAARHFVDIDSLKQLVDTMRFYKFSTMHLWLEDRAGFLKDFPKLPADYTREELIELSRYASQRGVSIAPEIDVPGHAPALSRAYPECFGALDAAGNRVALSCNNIASESFYEGMEKIYRGMREIFPDSAYWFLGFDEVSTASLPRAPGYEDFLKKHNLEKRALPYAANRLAQIVKGLGVTTPICWWAGGWHTEVPVGRILWVAAAEAAVRNQLPVVEYQLVGGKRAAANGQEIYTHDYYDLNRKGGPAAAPKDLLLGMDSASWETPGYTTVEKYQLSLPPTIESLWAIRPPRPFEDHARRAEATDLRLRKIISLVQVKAEGLLSSVGGLYETGKPVTVTLTAAMPGAIRYTTDGSAPTAQSTAYTKPFQISPGGKLNERIVRMLLKVSGKDLLIVRAQLFNEKGLPVGLSVVRDFWPTAPEYAYDLYLSKPGEIWTAIPNIESLTKAESGRYGDFAQLIRFCRPSQSFVMVVNGQIDVPDSGKYQFAPESSNPLQVFVDGKLVAETGGIAKKAVKKVLKKGQEPANEGEAVELAKGQHAYRMVYLNSTGGGLFNVQVKLPKGNTASLGSLHGHPATASAGASR